MPSLCSINPLENILFSTKMITSLRSVIILVGEKKQKCPSAIVFMPKSKWLRHFKCLFHIKIEASFIFMLLQHFAHFVRFWALKKGLKAPFLLHLRRVRDSNPRTCYSQQFSRLPHSTALPFLQ